jgi:hypothetical protein
MVASPEAERHYALGQDGLRSERLDRQEENRHPLVDRDEDGESLLAKTMIDVAERRWPEPRRALADVLRRLGGAR